MQDVISGLVVNAVYHALYAKGQDFVPGTSISAVDTVTTYARTTFANAVNVTNFSATNTYICVASTDRTYAMYAVDQTQHASGAIFEHKLVYYCVSAGAYTLRLHCCDEGFS